jgi:hypothetical protein
MKHLNEWSIQKSFRAAGQTKSRYRIFTENVAFLQTSEYIGRPGKYKGEDRNLDFWGKHFVYKRRRTFLYKFVNISETSDVPIFTVL